MTVGAVGVKKIEERLGGLNRWAYGRCLKSRQPTRISGVKYLIDSENLRRWVKEAKIEADSGIVNSGKQLAVTRLEKKGDVHV